MSCTEEPTSGAQTHQSLTLPAGMASSLVQISSPLAKVLASASVVSLFPLQPRFKNTDIVTTVQFGLSKTSFAIIRILQQYSKIQTKCDNDVVGEAAEGNARVPKHLGFSLMPKKFSVRFFREK